VTASEVYVAGKQDEGLSRFLAQRLKDAGVGAA
jgi:hypothetical protein